MSNVHGLFSGKKDDDDSGDDENNRFVGGIGERGGGSGLAVQPNMDEVSGGAAAGGNRDRVFGLAQNATSEDSNQVRRTITMYRDGFVVDDGPYRRLDDPNNAEFLRALAVGRTPRELLQDDNDDGSGNVVVGLVDKRQEDYVETFRSFSGHGTSLGTGDAAASSENGAANGTFDPATLPSTPPAVDDGAPTTSIAVRPPSGPRRVIRINLQSTVADLAAHLVENADGAPFRLVSGFPPKPLTDPTATVEAAGLKGAQVSMQKAG